ncbi:hypothetical protein [Chryseobacterium mulctrae]|uniref:hypothetical protein n=1 Tax=Chryseobacterium mulctrae TaxID=2576777 RepID=UPI001116F23B|nr:hypothetical protein [Chryseobacterium mulctrae]
MSDKILFFKEIEDSLRPEGIRKSKSEFVDSFKLYNIKEESIDRSNNDLILHFDNSSSSWLNNFERDIKELFIKAQTDMEEIYLLENISGFKLYVEKSLKNILGLDQFGVATALIDDLLQYFKFKYDLDFSPSSINKPVNSLQVKDGIKKDDILELYNVSVDKYINDDKLSADDFYSIFAGENRVRLEFKCSSSDMVEYLRNLLPLLEVSTIKNVQEAGIVYSKNGTLITVNNYNKYLHKNKTTNVTLPKDLQEHFSKLKKQIK